MALFDLKPYARIQPDLVKCIQVKYQAYSVFICSCG